MSRMLGVTPIVLKGEDFSAGLIARRRLYWSNLPLAPGILTEFCDGENNSSRSGDGGLLHRRWTSSKSSWSLCVRLRRGAKGKLLPQALPNVWKPLLIVDRNQEILKPVRDIVQLDDKALPTLLRTADGLGQERINLLLDKNDDMEGDLNAKGLERSVVMNALDVRFATATHD